MCVAVVSNMTMVRLVLTAVWGRATDVVVFLITVVFITLTLMATALTRALELAWFVVFLLSMVTARALVILFCQFIACLSTAWQGSLMVNRTSLSSCRPSMVNIFISFSALWLRVQSFLSWENLNLVTLRASQCLVNTFTACHHLRSHLRNQVF